MKLWKDNRLDAEWAKPDEEIVSEFWASEYRDKVMAGLRLERALREFICYKLESVFDEEEFVVVLRLAAKAWPRKESAR